MNYYEHHLGDWAAATGHLTWDEDMAYTRLLRAYYHAERAIPEGQQYRLAKAATPGQRKAVDAVIAEFFILADGHYHQKRADAEIERYQDKQRKAKASANARWSQSERNANASPNAMRTHSEGNALQTPDTRHQEEIQPPSPPGMSPLAVPKASKPEKPAGLADQTWADWTALRKAKKAPVTQTVIDAAIAEAQKAGMTTQAFFAEWCLRGSQGLKAAWLKPNERQQPADLPSPAMPPRWKLLKARRAVEMAGRSADAESREIVALWGMNDATSAAADAQIDRMTGHTDNIIEGAFRALPATMG